MPFQDDLYALDLASQNKRISRSIFRFMSITMGLGGCAWFVMCLLYGLTVQALVPAIYILATLYNMRSVQRNERVAQAATLQMLLSIALPFLMQTMLGGGTRSGHVMFWSFCAMGGALTFHRTRHIVAWVIVDILIMGVFALFDPQWSVGDPQALDDLPAPNILLTFNMVGTTFIIFGMAYRFIRVQGGVRKRNHEMKALIAQVNEDLERRHREIESSLAYARNIQQALLPDLTQGHPAIAQAMVLYRPKEHVGGDLIWQGSNQDHHLLVVADCTGHGVPGALLTMLVHNLLNETVHVHGITRPDLVVERVITRLPAILGQNHALIQDSAELAVVRIDHGNGQHGFAGYGIGLLEAAPDRCVVHPANTALPIIEPDRIKGSILCHPLELRPGTKLYAFTDGMAHQPGGVSGRKFSRTRLQRELFNLSHWPLDLQHEHISRLLEQWKGDHPQVDDILVVGFEPELRPVRARKRA